MKTKRFNILKLSVLFIMSGCALSAVAQQKTMKGTARDTSVSQLATDLAIGKNRAEQVKSALNYKRAEISKLMRDSSISPQEKHLRFKSMVMERRRKIDSVMTPAEKLKLKQVYGETTPRESKHLAEVAQRQEAAMNKVLHKQVTKAIQKDSVKRNHKAN
jgi:hypothetical protein